MERRSGRRHSKVCPCNEHVRVQTCFFSDLIKKLNDSKGNEKKLNNFLKKVDPCFIRFLGKCAGGILSMNNVRLSSKKHYKTLSEEKPLLRTLADSASGVAKKRQALLRHQKGGFLGVLAGIVASALGSMLLNKLTGSS